MNNEQWKKSQILTLLIVNCYLLIGCTSPPTPSAPVVIPEDFAGIVHAGHTNTPQEYALLDRMGANWVLTTFHWSRIEEEEGKWDFAKFDKYVDTAKASGKKIIGVLAYGVSWIHEDGKNRDYIPPDKVHFYLNYVQKTAEHFKGRVDAWCIWNEPNFLFWKGSRDEYLSLARQAADALREVDSEVILLGGAFNRGVFGLPTAYVKGLFESGAMEKADAVAFHPYDLNPNRTTKLFLEFRALTAKYGFEDRIWITEAGYPTGGWYPTAVSEKKFPAYIVKTFIGLAINGAKKVLWYQLFDPPERSKSNSENYFGLVRSEDDYTSKGAEAFRLCALYFSGATYHPDLPLRNNLPNTLRSFYFEKPSGGRTLVLWKDSGTISLMVQASENGYTRHDIVTGKTETKPAQTPITVGKVPVFITWQGGAAPSLQIKLKS